jgi:hypothetical protein
VKAPGTGTVMPGIVAASHGFYNQKVLCIVVQEGLEIERGLRYKSGAGRSRGCIQEASNRERFPLRLIPASCLFLCCDQDLTGTAG